MLTVCTAVWSTESLCHDGHTAGFHWTSNSVQRWLTNVCKL